MADVDLLSFVEDIFNGYKNFEQKAKLSPNYENEVLVRTARYYNTKDTILRIIDIKLTYAGDSSKYKISYKYNSGMLRGDKTKFDLETAIEMINLKQFNPMMLFEIIEGQSYTEYGLAKSLEFWRMVDGGLGEQEFEERYLYYYTDDNDMKEEARNKILFVNIFNKFIKFWGGKSIYD